MRWPPNKTWTSTNKREGYRHFEVNQYGGKREGRWIELYPVNNKKLLIKVHCSELETELWTSGWIQLPQEENCRGEL